MTAPSYLAESPAPGGGRRRWWLKGVVAVWIVTLVGLSLWSVRKDPPTVAEQRDIAAALPVLDRATGVLFAAAAAGDDRAVVLEGVSLVGGCAITPVREGVEATRDITVYVPVGRALAVLQDIAARLPSGYRAAAGSSSQGRRVGLRADAGEFVGIEASSDAEAQVLTLRTATGCRPRAHTELVEEPPLPAERPKALTEALRALRGPAADGVATRAVRCPEGVVAGTYTVEGPAVDQDLGAGLKSVVRGATVVRAEPTGWAYRLGTTSMVVTSEGGNLRVSASTSC